MTCIVGLEHQGAVYIGGDSAGIAGYDICTRGDEKVFFNDDVLMGFTSSFRMGQLLRYAFTVPEQSNKKADMAYLVTDFVDAVRAMYRDKGFLVKENEQEEGGTFLLGYRGKLYVVEDDFQVGIPTDGYASVGCGSNMALGALYATRGWSDPEKRVVTALEAAAQFSAGVRPPFTVLKLDPVSTLKQGKRKR